MRVQQGLWMVGAALVLATIGMPAGAVWQEVGAGSDSGFGDRRVTSIPAGQDAYGAALRQAGFATDTPSVIRIVRQHPDQFTRFAALRLLIEREGEHAAREALLDLFETSEVWVRLEIAAALATQPQHRQQVLRFARSLCKPQRWDDIVRQHKDMIEAPVLEAEERERAVQVRGDLDEMLEAARILALAGDQGGYPVIIRGLRLLRTAGPPMQVSALGGAQAYLQAGLPYDGQLLDGVLGVVDRTLKGQLIATASLDLAAALLPRGKAQKLLRLAMESPQPIVRAAAQTALQNLRSPD